MTEIIVFTNRFDGHHRSYVDILSNILGASSISSPISPAIVLRLITCQILVISTIDTSILYFLLIGLLRSLFLKRTVALFLRPQSCFDRGILPLVKRMLFNIVKQNPIFNVLTILPHTIYPSYAFVSSGWIYDPQFWDLYSISNHPSLPESYISSAVLAAKGQRKVFAYLGRTDKEKNFTGFYEHALMNSDKYFYLIVGIIAKEYSSMVNDVRSLHSFIVEGYVSELEFLSCFKVSDFVWCYYDKSYDQSSGLYGRCLQSNTKAIVRPFSAISIFDSSNKLSPLQMRDQSIATLHYFLRI
jgi:hypothetical protein